MKRYKTIEGFKNTQKGEDIYVIGSGPSLNYYPKGFFKNKLTVGVNNIFRVIAVDYLVLHHYTDWNGKNLIIEGSRSGVKNVIVSEYETCRKSWAHHSKIPTGDIIYYFYRHIEQSFVHVHPNDTDDQILTIAGTTVINAMSFALHLGASNIILCGCDGMSINNEINIRGYPVPTNDKHPGNVQGTIRRYAEYLEKDKNVGVVSINPFFNFKEYELKTQ